jgi:tight adherence protein B
MGTLIFTFLVIWGLCVGLWWVITKFVRTSDIGKIKSRLVGNVAAKKKERQQREGPALIQSEDKHKDKIAMRLLLKFKLKERLQTLLEQAGLRWTVIKFVHTSLTLFLIGYGIAWVLLPANLTMLALAPAFILGFAPLIHVIRQRASRLHKFEEQFPESLEFVARSMRAGHAFSVSLEMIHREFQEPLAGEFRRTFEEHNLGLPLDVALEKLSKRVPSLDVHFFVSAVMLQKRTGGNLAEILDKLAFIIRERFKLRGRIRAISAHGKMTSTALTSIPIGVAVLLFWANPDYVRFFIVDETGNIMAASAIGLQIIGYMVMKKIVSIEV